MTIVFDISAVEFSVGEAGALGLGPKAWLCRLCLAFCFC